MKNHDTKRIRMLLLHKKQIITLSYQSKKPGYTIMPISLYFNRKGLAKLEIGLCLGKKIFDKRRVIKERELKRHRNEVKLLKLA